LNLILCVSYKLALAVFPIKSEGNNVPHHDSPGRRMIEKQIPVKAGIHTLTGYSAHADQNMLVNWVKSMPRPLKKITLVHGEPKARKALSQALGL